MKVVALLFGSIAICLAGCSMARNDGTIPTGTWEGRGVYTGRDMATDEGKDATTPAAKKPGHSAEYDVKLTIQPVRQNNNELIELKVFSNHANDPDFEGKSVYVRATLRKAERVSASANLYELVGKSYDISFKEPEKYTEVDPPMMASCMTVGDETVLTLRYEPDFAEVYRFKGNTVQKAGSFGNKDNCIYWSESLTRR